MDKHVIWADGEKVILEDLNALGVQSGSAGDGVFGATKRIFVEQTNAKGYVEPWADGPLVLANGASGTLLVRPFRAFKSATGSTTTPGTDTASEDTQTHEQVISAYYGGGSATVPTPPTVASGNVRWDILYAIVTETDSDQASRLVTPAGGVGGVQTIFTRHKAVVTLAWVQGTAITEGTVPISGQLGQLPMPAAGTAVIPLAYVRVNKTNTPSTTTYTYDQIANCPRLARPNGSTHSNAGVSARLDTGAAIQIDPVSLLTLSAANGGWGTNAADKRPASYIGQIKPGGEIWLTLGPFSTTVAHKTFAAGWTVLTTPLASPDVASVLHDYQPTDWRNRLFFARLSWGEANSATCAFAWDPSVAASARKMPAPDAIEGGSGIGVLRYSSGNSVAENTVFNASSGIAGYRVIAMFHDVANQAGAADDIALLVNTSTGALHIAAREATANAVNGGEGILKLEYSGQTAPYGF